MMRFRSHHSATPLILLLCALLLNACSDPSPIKIGFIAGTSGRVADLGIGGRNGAQLAVEQRNRSGGIHGREIELLLRDDEQNPDKARQGVTELIDAGVELIVGPMTSSMGMAVVNIANERGVTLISPTVTTTLLEGKDDQFFRVISTTRHYVERNARYHRERLGINSAVIAIDLNNRAYSENWANGYKKAFEANGGKVLHIQEFSSSPELHFDQIAAEINQYQADVTVLACNSVDAALLIQQLRRLGNQKPIATSGWASTERLIQLGGAAVEGVHTAQFFNRDSLEPDYIAFRESFLQRFDSEPGFAGTAAYEAMTTALTTLANKNPGVSIKAALLSQRTYKGVQQDIIFDEFGDATRKTFMSIIKDGKFTVIE